MERARIEGGGTLRTGMDPSQFLTASRILIVAGKGGVGKTTVAATLGVAASRLGIDTLLVEIEGKRGLATLFGEEALVYDDTEFLSATETGGRAQLRARAIKADAALLDYLEDYGLTRFRKTLSRLQVLDTLATSTPGLKDLIVLGKIKQLGNTDPAQLIIVDAPASGHAVSFLRAARGLQQHVNAGRVRRQADEVGEMLTDPASARVLLVTVAEATPVKELIETAYALEDDVGIRLGPTVINGLYPARQLEGAVSQSAGVDPNLASEAAAAAAFWVSRATEQQEQIERLAEELPLEQLRLPRRLTTRLGTADLEQLADVLLEQVEALKFEALP